MSASWGRVALGLSGIGFPLTQVAIRRLGVGGAAAVEGLAVGLLVRDTWLIATGTPRRLRRWPATLLCLEAAAAACATLVGIRLLVDADARLRATADHSSLFETSRRAAIGALFGLHTIRFRIYLSPDRGRS